MGGEKVVVTTQDVNEVQRSISEYKTSMEINAGVLDSLIENSNEWNDSQSKKFEEIIKQCSKQLKNVAEECGDKNQELEKVKKLIEKYNNVFDAFH